MRKEFMQQLEELKSLLIEMGGLNESALENALAALKTGEEEMSQKTIALELQINQKEREIESLCLDLLLMEHPVASDLRMVSAALKMITDLERIGDQAADIAEIAMIGEVEPDSMAALQKMAEEVMIMMRGSIDAFVRQDLLLAKETIGRDDRVDDCFLAIRSRLIDQLGRDPNRAASSIDAIMIAKYLERIADHTTNIAEWVVFVITGYHPKQEGIAGG